MNNNQINDGKLGLKDTISMATGFAIGSGVITMTGIAIGMTGRSVVVSYLLSAVLFMFAVIPSLIVAAVYPVRSASYTYSTNLIHPRLGGFYMFIYFLGRLTIATFSISFAQYLAALIDINQTITAVVILTISYVVNMFGVKAAAKVQNIMFYILVACLGLFIVMGLFEVDFSAFFSNVKFNAEPFFQNGFDGVFSAASLLMFAVGGAGVLVDFGSLVRNPEKVIPKVVIWVTIGVTVAYALLSIVASGLLPYDDVAYQPLTNSAAAVFGEGSFMYVLFICGGALLALTTTLNSSFVWYSNAMRKGCEDGWFPKALAKENKHGVPYRLVTLFYLFGLIPALIQMDITVLSKMAVGLTTFMWMIPAFALVNLPKRMPEAWNKSKFAKLPQWSLWLMCIISFAIYGSQSISNFKGNPKESNIIIVVYIIFSAAYVLLKKKIPTAQIPEGDS